MADASEIISVTTGEGVRSSSTELETGEWNPMELVRSHWDDCERKVIQNFVDQLPSVPIESLPQGEASCAVCLEQYASSQDEAPVMLSCGHKFGNKCILRWLVEENWTCPMCRSLVFKAPTEMRENHIWTDSVEAIQNRTPEGLLSWETSETVRDVQRSLLAIQAHMRSQDADGALDEEWLEHQADYYEYLYTYLVHCRFYLSVVGWFVEPETQSLNPEQRSFIQFFNQLLQELRELIELNEAHRSAYLAPSYPVQLGP